MFLSLRLVSIQKVCNRDGILKLICNQRKLHTSFSYQSNSTRSSIQSKKLKSTLYYVTATGVLVIGLSYAAVPLYRMFCQAYSYGGTLAGHDSSKVETMKAIKHRPITIKFNADTASSMRWNFKPQQREITVSCTKR